MSWGSGIRDLEKTYPGSGDPGVAPNPGSRSTTLDFYIISGFTSKETAQKLLEAEYDFVDCEG